MPYPKFILDNSALDHYIGLDLVSALDYGDGQKPDRAWDGVKMPFDANGFDLVIATEVLEHCRDPDQTLREIFRVLGSSGLFFFTVPFLWDLLEVPHDEYRYTLFALERHLRAAGFAHIDILAAGGVHASLAHA